MDAGFDWGAIQRSLPYLFKEGMTFTVTLTLLAMTGGIIFGTILAMMRLSSIKAIAVIAGAYVNLMRSIPLVLVHGFTGGRVDFADVIADRLNKVQGIVGTSTHIAFRTYSAHDLEAAFSLGLDDA